MAIDWGKIYKKYRGQWVALADDEKTVLAAGATASTALKKAKLDGYNNPVIAFIPKQLVTYIGAMV